NIDKMAAGHPLDDDDRWPWLGAIATWIDGHIAAHQAAVVTCSALKRKYRDVLRRPEVQIVFLDGSRELIASRLAARHGHFFKPAMLDSQLAALEPPQPDEQAVVVSIDGTTDQIVDSILGRLGLAV